MLAYLYRYLLVDLVAFGSRHGVQGLETHALALRVEFVPVKVPPAEIAQWFAERAKNSGLSTVSSLWWEERRRGLIGPKVVQRRMNGWAFEAGSSVVSQRSNELMDAWIAPDGSFSLIDGTRWPVGSPPGELSRPNAERAQFNSRAIFGMGLLLGRRVAPGRWPYGREPALRTHEQIVPSTLA